MYDTLLPLLIILAAFYLWHNALRAREQARSLAHALCARASLQLLDQTVALRRVSLRRIPGEGLRLLQLWKQWKGEDCAKIDAGWDQAKSGRLLSSEQVRENLASRKENWRQRNR